ncbi:peptidyl-prolyl cis-trans isomerase [Asticcacaulis solisilvae]|uniref:peptidyl-prolyl cis-trans isomerase n=1 Tax=Asticcacaulis solisilvae TaxID=1217274 RepID=UPI003FD89A67
MALSNILTKPLPWTSAKAEAKSRASSGGPRLPGWFRAAAREPFVHFILLGAIMFTASETVEHFTTQYRVAIGPDRVARLIDTYRQQFGQDPSATQLKTLVDNYVKEEIEYRESTALGLDRDDEIVRRRLVQKYEFLQQDLQTLEDPTEQTLRAYYAAHASNYGEPAKRSFTQVYFSPDNGGDDAAHARAETELKKLNASGAARAPEDGDVFPGPTDLVDLDQGDTERLFGQSDLSRDLFTAKAGQWAGPFRSGFGWHLVRVTDARSGATQPYDAVASRVLDDWKASQRDGLNAKNFAKLKAKYNVVIEGTKK